MAEFKKSQQVGNVAITVLQAVEALNTFKMLMMQASAALKAISGLEEVRVEHPFDPTKEQTVQELVQTCLGMPHLPEVGGLIGATAAVASSLCGVAASQQQREKLEKVCGGSLPQVSS